MSIEESADAAITAQLQQWRSGDSAALERLAATTYTQLRILSADILRRHRPDVDLQPTILVNELYLKLPRVRETDWQSRSQFFNTAARMMRNILVDRARSRQALRRGGESGTLVVALAEQSKANDYRFQVDVLSLHDALDRFAECYPRHAHGVELRFFGGLTSEEVAAVLSSGGEECSVRTVERDWNFSKAWLQDYLGPV